MKHFFKINLIALLGLALTTLAADPAFAVGTGAGVSISNQATLDYEVGSVNQPDILSDGDGIPGNGNQPTLFKVDNRVDLTMAGGNNVAATGIDQIITFTIENTGNETQGYSLELFTGDNTTDGDTIDMTGITVYLDSDKDGVGDSIYVLGTGNNIVDVPANSGLASTINILVEADVPGTAVNGDTASYTLKATTLNTGTTTVTTATVGVDTTAVDVVLADSDAGPGMASSTDGPTNGQFLATATYTVRTTQLSITKTAAVISDPINGISPNAKAIPGATVRYTIIITNAGVPAADAIVMTDPIPGNTKFVVNSLTDSTGANTFDYDDTSGSFTYLPVDGGDGGDVNVSDVRVTVPTIAGGNAATITFDVLIL